MTLPILRPSPEQITRLIPGTALCVILAYIFGMTLFLYQHTHFIGDDLDHFSHAVKLSLPEMMLTRIDVHFVPFHKLLSYIIFKLDPLNFNLALIVIAGLWSAATALLFSGLRRLTSISLACIITTVIATSPAWIHTLIWWSSAAHRLPYLALQGAALLIYLRHRSQPNPLYLIVGMAVQLIALGFYVKAILFPLIFMGMELCLAASNRKLSRAGIKMCLGFSVVSAAYVIWYLISSGDGTADHDLSITSILQISTHLILRLGGLSLLFPAGSFFAELICAAILAAAATWSICRRPSSAVPIAVLMAILMTSFALNTVGRGGIIAFPFGAMRYYSDEILVVAIFLGFITSHHLREHTAPPTGGRGQALTALSILLIYPIASFHASQSLFTQIYPQHVESRQFMHSLDRTLNQASSSSPRPLVMSANFPEFMYSFLGARKPMAAILGAAYPEVNWWNPELMTAGVYRIGDDGVLHPFAMSSAPPLHQ